jgi:fatty acid desaturase
MDKKNIHLEIIRLSKISQAQKVTYPICETYTKTMMIVMMTIKHDCERRAVFLGNQ